MACGVEFDDFDEVHQIQAVDLAKICFVNHVVPREKITNDLLTNPKKRGFFPPLLSPSASMASADMRLGGGSSALPGALARAKRIKSFLLLLFKKEVLGYV